MGLIYFPLISLQLVIDTKFIAYRNSNNPFNPFQWSHSKLNQPGYKSYTPKLTWVMKLRSGGHLESEVFIYTDYGHVIAQSELVCWQAANIFCCICNLLGIQDAYRKRTEPSLTPVPWWGTVTHTSRNEVVITAKEVKWGKTRILVL